MLDSNTSKVTWVAVAVGIVAMLGAATVAMFPGVLGSGKLAMLDTITSFTDLADTTPKAENTAFTYNVLTASTVEITGFNAKAPAYADKNTMPSVVRLDGKKVTVTQIGTNAFKDNRTFTQMTLPDTVTILGDYAFSGTALTSLVLPDSVKQIYVGTFAKSDITDITFDDNLTTIGQFAFEGAGNLRRVTLPDSVTWVGSNAFDTNNVYGQSKLSYLNYNSTKTHFVDSVVSRVDEVVDRSKS